MQSYLSTRTFLKEALRFEIELLFVHYRMNVHSGWLPVPAIRLIAIF